MNAMIEQLINETERYCKMVQDFRGEDFRKSIYEIESNKKYLYIHKYKGFTVNYSFAQNELVLLFNYFSDAEQPPKCEPINPVKTPY